MRFIRITGLCLVAMFVVSMVASATASAAPVWEQLEGSTWKEVKTTEKVTSAATLKLTDKKGGLTGGKVVVECSGTSTSGTIGPGKYDRVVTITVASCRNIEGCVGTVTAEARNLPWQTELYETEAGKVRDRIVSEVSGKFPGWKVECTLSDTCEANTTTAMTNNANNTVSAVFDALSANANCSRGGTGQGEVRGTNIIKENESPYTGVRVS